MHSYLKEEDEGRKTFPTLFCKTFPKRFLKNIPKTFLHINNVKYVNQPQSVLNHEELGQCSPIVSYQDSGKRVRSVHVPRIYAFSETVEQLEGNKAVLWNPA